MRTTLLFLFLLAALPSGTAWSTDTTFESLAEIRDWIHARKGFGNPKFESLELDSGKFHFAYFIPTSGLDYCHVYSFRGLGGVWRLAHYSQLPGGCKISIRLEEASGQIVIHGRDGVELDRVVP